MPDRRGTPPGSVSFIFLTVFGFLAYCHSRTAQRLLDHNADIDHASHLTASNGDMDRQTRLPTHRPLQI